MAQTGIVFFASGQDYIEKARPAIARSMRFNDVPHLLFCSETPESDIPSAIQLFKPSKNVWLDRIACLRHSPFDETIYLDLDCNVLASIVELFDLLSTYDIAAAHAPGYRGLADPEVCPAFFELNCGVIVFRQCNKIVELFDAWASVYRAWYRNPPFAHNVSNVGDQASFRHALWKLKVPIYVLGPEYNWRPAFPSFLCGRPKILHGYHDDPERIAALANADAEYRPRVFGRLMPHLQDLSRASGEID